MPKCWCKERYGSDICLLEIQGVTHAQMDEYEQESHTQPTAIAVELIKAISPQLMRKNGINV